MTGDADGAAVGEGGGVEADGEAGEGNGDGDSGADDGVGAAAQAPVIAAMSSRSSSRIARKDPMLMPTNRRPMCDGNRPDFHSSSLALCDA